MMHMLLSTILGTTLWAGLSSSARCGPAITLDKKPQIFVLSDISLQSPDSMSFVRLLLHSDQYNITGLTAVTSYWNNNTVYPDAILNITRAYGEVVNSLNSHSAGEFPTKEYLASIVKSGPTAYGTEALGLSPMSSGASHLIDVVDGITDGEILHCSVWGGINTIAEALYYIHDARAPSEIDRFIKKLRIYSISDRDNAGSWIRAHFPSIPYITSLTGFNQYGLATWAGISGEQRYNFDYGGPNSSLVSQEYISKHFQLGPLGAHYPDLGSNIMEANSPALLHTMMNGLNGGPYDHPEWGGWGGRYILQDISRQTMLYNDAADNVLGVNGRWFTSNHATIWRWRTGYQEEMSARMQWSINSNYSTSSHPPVIVLNGSCDSSPLIFNVSPDELVTLDASASYDPDANLSNRNPIQFDFFQYKEPSGEPVGTDANFSVPTINLTLSDDGRVASAKIPRAAESCYEVKTSPASTACFAYHILLKITGSGTPPIRRWKRAVLQVHHPQTLQRYRNIKGDDIP